MLYRGFSNNWRAPAARCRPAGVVARTRVRPSEFGPGLNVPVDLTRELVAKHKLFA